jgi:hypothetical protein
LPVDNRIVNDAIVIVVIIIIIIIYLLFTNFLIGSQVSFSCIIYYFILLISRLRCTAIVKIRLFIAFSG